MPIYEYRCPNCHQVFEEWCKHAEEADVTHACPVCKTESKRLISNTSFALKGGGWYVTEYGSHKGQSEVSTDAAAGASTGTAAAASTAGDTAGAVSTSSPLPPPAPPGKAELAATAPAAGVK